jgi:uncharacterized membrane protein (DUF106 family)
MLVPLPIKPLIAFALLENEKVSPLALQVLKDITENSLVKETKQEAERNMKMLEEILKNRQEMNSRNKQRVFETFKVCFILCFRYFVSFFIVIVKSKTSNIIFCSKDVEIQPSLFFLVRNYQRNFNWKLQKDEGT